MPVTAKDVKRLRDATGVGMMDCKRALEEADGDFDRAVEILRKKGQKVAAKRADREAEEGLVVTAVADDRQAGAIAEVNCETDFVARNDDFQTFARRVADLVLRERPADLDTLHALRYDEDDENDENDQGATVEQALTDLTGRIGEKIAIRRFAVLETSGGTVISYVHPGSRLGVLVDMHGNGNLKDVGRDVAMQVAALDPVAAFREEVPNEVRRKEQEIAREAALREGKPEHVLDRLAEGKLERYFKDHVLVEQPFVKDSSVTVRQVLDEADAEVRRFVRYALGT